MCDVLIVDDDALMLRALGRLFPGSLLAETFDGAIRLAATHRRIAAVVFDGGVGLSKMPHLRELAPHAVFVVFTGRPNRSDAELAKRLGAEAYLAKDNLQELREAVEAALSAWRDPSPGADDPGPDGPQLH